MDTHLNSQEVEIYAVFMNIDKSITLLNPIIENLGFQFVEIPFNALEKYFSEAFYFNYHPITKDKQNLPVNFQDIGLNIISPLFKRVMTRQF